MARPSHLTGDLRRKGARREFITLAWRHGSRLAAGRTRGARGAVTRVAEGIA
jgi:hypothetical protein